MGKLFTNLTVINRADQIRAESGIISPDAIRSITFNQVLVDRKTTTLCLPRDAIAQLGLKFLKEVDVATAMGIGKARILWLRHAARSRCKHIHVWAGRNI